ncbi:MAG TPA: serine/threonine-protein kinase [Gemmatimonadales bacterium]|nr:serine/threonine-protein kinase [Gemmatimonadales bacterium]
MSDDGLTPERWARVLDLFSAALERSGAERQAFIDAAGAADPALAREVRSLLDAHERGGPVPDPEPAATPLPPSLQWVGPYRLLRELGRGGMGTVYLVERTGEGFTQTAALKLLRADFADPRMAARLTAERRILARLEHPGIARFIDGGTTGAGQPYVAMEHVAGTPLLAYCARQRLALHDRLALFVEICDAVQYAHSQLVVHRDLKPGNILVTAEGHPKLLDFGVAKILDDSAPEAGLTHTGLWATPAYASPEQMRQEPVTTLTDVYALGVILYELLTGRLPYRVEAGSVAEMVRVVCEVIPDRPSVAVARAEDEVPVRGFTAEVMTTGSRSRARALARRLSGDLDTITLKALAKAPGRRYQSVEQLAEDIRRYLDGHPVLARPDSIGYRASKFVHRHRLAVTAAALLGLSLIGGVGATLWQASAARRERDRAADALRQSEDVTTFLLDLFQVADPRSTPGDTVAGRAILRQGLARVDELRDQPAVQASMLDALGMVLVSIGHNERARELVERGLRLRQQIFGPAHLDVAESLRHLARVQRAQGEYADADTALRQAMAIEEAALGPDHPRLAETLSEHGFLLPYLARDPEPPYRRALEIRRRALGPDHPLVGTSMGLVAGAARWKGDLPRAETLWRETLAFRRRVRGAEHADVAEAMLHLGDLLAYRGVTGEAERLFREALAVQRRTIGAEHPQLAHGLGSLAALLASRGEFAEAESLLRESLAIQLHLFGPDHSGVAGSFDALARLALRQGRLAQAESLQRVGLATWRRAVGPEHSATAGSMGNLADILAARGRYDEAERLVRDAIAIRAARHGPGHPLVAVMWLQIAHFRLAQRDYAAVERLARDALDLFAAVGFASTHERVLEANSLLAEALKRVGG